MMCYDLYQGERFMKYLFFDIECASVHNGSKMCSFGYVITDEHLNIIEEDDLIINPKSEWDWYALENILFYKKEYYESFPSFDKRYERIKGLFDENTVALGHGITNDVRFINDDCKRYNLPFIDFIFYDCADIYKEFENDKQVKSLEKVSKEIGYHEQGERHRSLEDAKLVHEYTKEMCKQMDCTIDELLHLAYKCKGKNVSGNCSYRNRTNKEKKERKNPGKLYEYFIKYVKPNCEEDKVLKGRKIAISCEFEKNNFKPMLLIIQLITNLGGEYVVDSKQANVFVCASKPNKNGYIEYCDREIEIDSLIEEGKDIEKLNLYEFLGIINYDEDKVKENYETICKNISKIIRKEEAQNKKVKVK